MHPSHLKQLRSGQVPRELTHYPLVGREALIEELTTNLEEARLGEGGFKMLVGAYGLGKSLIANVMKDKALTSGFVVSHLQLDENFRMHRFEDVYYHLMHQLHLYTPDGVKKISIDRLVDRWVNDIRQSTDKREAHQRINRLIASLHDDHPTFARAFFSLIRAKITGDAPMVHATASWLSGDLTVPQEVKKQFEVKGGVDKHNAFDFLRAFCHLIKEMGYGGLYLIIDELDLLGKKRSDLKRRSLENLRTLIDFSTGGELPHLFLLLLATPDLIEAIDDMEALSQRLLPGGPDTVKKPTVFLRGLTFEEAATLTESFLEAVDLPREKAPTYRNLVLINLQKRGVELSPLNPRIYVTELVAVLDYLAEHPHRRPDRYDVVLRETAEGIRFFHQK